MTDPARQPADAKYEEQARLLFPLDVSPEEYAARHAHEWGCFSFDEYQFSDARLDAWIQRLGDILFARNGAPTVEALRRLFLSDGERATIARLAQEEF